MKDYNCFTILCWFLPNITSMFVKGLGGILGEFKVFPGGPVVKICLPMREMPVWSLSLKYPLEKDVATHSSIFAWEVSWTEELDKLQCVGLQQSLFFNISFLHLVQINVRIFVPLVISNKMPISLAVRSELVKCNPTWDHCTLSLQLRRQLWEENNNFIYP